MPTAGHLSDSVVPTEGEQDVRSVSDAQSQSSVQRRTFMAIFSHRIAVQIFCLLIHIYTHIYMGDFMSTVECLNFKIVQNFSSPSKLAPEGKYRVLDQNI